MTARDALDAKAQASARLRGARPQDAAAVWQLVDSDGVLDRNSPYAYLLLSDLFGATCRVAEEDGRLLGFVAALRPPMRQDAVFVWQIAVDPAARGRGLAGRLLDDLVRAPGCRDVRALEATVTPDNAASRALFRSFARRHDAPCNVIRNYYPAPLFPGDGHEQEDLFRIGPFSVAAAG